MGAQSWRKILGSYKTEGLMKNFVSYLATENQCYKIKPGMRWLFGNVYNFYVDSYIEAVFDQTLYEIPYYGFKFPFPILYKVVTLSRKHLFHFVNIG
jgi:hypothetical protein